MIFDWSFALEILPILAKAALITIEATILSFILAMVLGLVLALMRMARNRFISLTAFWFIEAIRGTPLLVQLFILFLVLPKYGITMPAFMTGIIGLGIHYSAYCAEVYRSGLDNVPRGQWEASTALNLSSYWTFRRVILPQAIPPIIPALGTYLISLFKETPLLSAVAVIELMQQALLIGSDYF
ncbi:MAG: ectoine/hydroxyectoine ABC transporter permease subunit EhuD, partial [Planctomycetota bacterium]